MRVDFEIFAIFFELYKLRVVYYLLSGVSRPNLATRARMTVASARYIVHVSHLGREIKSKSQSRSSSITWQADNEQRLSVWRQFWHRRPHHVISPGVYHSAHCLGKTPP